MSNRKQYSPDFREAAAREVVLKSRPIVDVARELGVKPQTLGKWVAALRESLDPDAESYTPEEKKKIRELEKKVREQQDELDFLKKAAAFFARNQP